MQTSISSTAIINSLQKKRNPWTEATVLLRVYLVYFYFLWRCGPTRARASSFLRFLDHTHWMHHSRQDSSGRVISSSQRPLPDNTQHSQQTDIHACGGIRTHNLSRRAAADLRLRPLGHWDRLLVFGLFREINAQQNDDFLNYSFQISFHPKNKPDRPHRHFIFILLYHVMSCTLEVKQIFEWLLPRERDRTSSVSVVYTSCTLYCFLLVKTKQSQKEFICKNVLQASFV